MNNSRSARMMADWNSKLLGGNGPDRVERLLHSCKCYYHAGDHDIAVLLLKEAERELLKQAPDDTLVRVADAQVRA
jgi:hypothetical protein